MELLRTERLILRAFRMADAPDVAQYAGDIDVARMLARVPHPYRQSEAEEWIAGHPQAPSREGDFPFAIEADGAFVGCIGYQTDTGEAGDETFEIGYWIARPCWGRGFATETARAFCRFLFEKFGPAALSAGHFEDNPASGHVLTKLGFRYTGKKMSPCVARGHDVRARTMRLQREDAGTLPAGLCDEISG